jgi:hypothetical protein
MDTRCSLLGVGLSVCWLGCSDHARLLQLNENGELVPVEEPAPEAEGAAATGEGESPAQQEQVAPLQPAAPASELVEIEGAEFTPGAPPSSAPAVALPKIVSLTGPAGVTNGGSALLHALLEPPLASQLFVVSVAGDSGYLSVLGQDADGDGSQEIEVQVRTAVQTSPLVISVAPSDGQGGLGDFAEISLELVPSGFGDVKITLSFPPGHDLDLHVFEPDNSEISYLRPMSASGGVLDLDSGANCTPSLAGAENVFWPPGAAPTGRYRVSVTDFEQCERGPIDFSVRVENGPFVDTYRGSFTDRSEGTSVDVVTFTH